MKYQFKTIQPAVRILIGIVVVYSLLMFIWREPVVFAEEAEPGHDRFEAVSAPPDVVFAAIVEALLKHNIKIASAIKDAGLITTGPCLDFHAEYQILISRNTDGTSRIAVSAKIATERVAGLLAFVFGDQPVINLAVGKIRPILATAVDAVNMSGK